MLFIEISCLQKCEYYISLTLFPVPSLLLLKLRLKYRQPTGSTRASEILGAKIITVSHLYKVVKNQT